MAFLTSSQRNRDLNVFPSLERTALGRLLGGDPLVGAGTANGATVFAQEFMQGAMRQTIISLKALPQTVVNGTEYQGSKIYDFPEGQIIVYGAVGSIAQTTTSVIATTLNSGVTGALALGTATASNVSLTSTMANIAPSIAFTTSTVINVAGTAVTPFLAAPIILNGTGTAIDLYLNTAYATTGDVDAAATQTLSGSIIITWMSLADI